MKAGDRFTWLRSESSHEFGELCEVTGVHGDKMSYRFVNRPTWRTVTCPSNWFDGQKEYSSEEISAIKKRYKQKRRLSRYF